MKNTVSEKQAKEHEVQKVDERAELGAPLVGTSTTIIWVVAEEEKKKKPGR